MKKTFEGYGYKRVVNILDKSDVRDIIDSLDRNIIAAELYNELNCWTNRYKYILDLETGKTSWKHYASGQQDIFKDYISLISFGISNPDELGYEITDRYFDEKAEKIFENLQTMQTVTFVDKKYNKTITITADFEEVYEISSEIKSYYTGDEISNIFAEGYEIDFDDDIAEQLEKIYS